MYILNYIIVANNLYTIQLILNTNGEHIML